NISGDGYGSRRDPHTFPTRRSSDLHLVALADPKEEREHAEDGGERRHQDRPDTSPSRFDHGSVALFPGCAQLVDEIDEDDGVVEDRKSTRLNSSHVKMSYAVFCLKK